MKWEDNICSCWHLEGRRQLPMCESFSGDQAPLHRPSLSLSDKWPFRCLSFRACSGSILSLQFVWRPCNLLSEGPGVSVASTYCWRVVPGAGKRSQGWKVPASTSPSVPQFFMLELLSTVGINFDYQQIYISRKTILFAVCKTLVEGSWNEVRTGPAM